MGLLHLRNAQDLSKLWIFKEKFTYCRKLGLHSSSHSPETQTLAKEKERMVLMTGEGDLGSRGYAGLRASGTQMRDRGTEQATGAGLSWNEGDSGQHALSSLPLGALLYMRLTD